ncbi:MAG: TraR/DksA C4-type zinc finger protein [Marmoricola sp.]
MAKTGSRSLASRARSAARRVVGGDRTQTSVGAAENTTKQASVKAPAKATAKKAPVKKAAAKKAPVKKAAPSKAAARKAPAKKAAPRGAAKNAPTGKTPPKVAAPKAARKTPVKTPVEKSPAKKAPVKKAPATAVAKTPAKSTAPAKAAVKKAAARATPAQPPPTHPKARKGSPAALVVLTGESPWTKDELAEVRTHLRADVKRLAAELEVAEHELAGLMRDAGDGAGQDQADVGSTTFERDQEMVITNNARDMLTQSRHALERIQDGTFGVCESCGEPIGKMRLMAFPRATLCMTCKQREERR